MTAPSWKITLLVSLVLAGVPYTQSEGMSIPEIFAKGTTWEIGYQIGWTFKDFIAGFIRADEYLQMTLLPFIKNPVGNMYYKHYLSVVQKNFPQYYKELQGIADGALLDISKIFTLAIAPELSALIKRQYPQGSSDVYINYPGHAAIGHNTDGDPLIRIRAYILHAIVLNETGGHVVENFTSFTYPGGLPGNEFSFNGDGKVFTVNPLHPSTVEINKIPRNFLTRAMLAVKTQDELEQLLNNPVGAANGFNVNFADLKNTTYSMTSYEVAPLEAKKPGSLVTRYTVGMMNPPAMNAYNRTGYYFHFNMYNHTNMSQVRDDLNSSEHRLARVNQLPVPKDITAIRNILGDTADQKFPIYRTFRPTDQHIYTLSTGIFDLSHCKLHIYKNNPKTSNGPLTALKLPWCIP